MSDTNKTLSNIKGFLVNTILILMFCTIISSCVKWEWDECRKVGHGKLYCVASLVH